MLASKLNMSQFMEKLDNKSSLKYYLDGTD